MGWPHRSQTCGSTCQVLRTSWFQRLLRTGRDGRASARAADDRHLDFRSDAFAYVEPGRPLTLTVYGRGVSAATLRVHRLADLAGTLEEAVALPRGPAVRTVPVKLKQDVRYYVQEDVRLQPLPEGVYLAELQTAAGRDHVVLVVSQLLLVSKVAARELVACTVDTTTGKPLPGVDVRVYQRKDSRRGSRLQAARTGPDGVLRLPLPTEMASYDVVGQNLQGQVGDDARVGGGGAPAVITWRPIGLGSAAEALRRPRQFPGASRGPLSGRGGDPR